MVSHCDIIIQLHWLISDDEWAGVGAHLCLEFRVFLINLSTKKYTQEKRIISYWFKEFFPNNQRATAAQDFFKKLVSPVSFPRGEQNCLERLRDFAIEMFQTMSALSRR